MFKPGDLSDKAIILGVRITDQPIRWVMEKIKSFLASKKQHKIFTPNPEICLKALKDETYRKTLNKADINIPDGFGLKLGALILGDKLKNRITGVDLSKEILILCNEMKLKVYVVIRKVSLTSEKEIIELFKKDYSNINVQVSSIDIKTKENTDKTVNKINDFQPQVLFVSLGAPHQEIFINQYLNFLSSVKLALGVGGTFDFLSGKMQRAPKQIRNLGMEWLYRLYKEPKRLKRIKHATADFLLACHRWKTRMNSTLRPNVLGVIKNKEGKILVQKNPRFNHWQFPQGGIDKNENPQDAIVREVSEELGAPEKLFKVVKQFSEKHSYDWPPYARLLKGYMGQAQTAFLLEYLGTDDQFNFEGSDEADAILWLDKNKVVNKISQQRQEFAKKLLAEK